MRILGIGWGVEEAPYLIGVSGGFYYFLWLRKYRSGIWEKLGIQGSSESYIRRSANLAILLFYRGYT